MSFYSLLETALLSDNVDLKKESTHRCIEYCTKNILPQSNSARVFEKPSYASFCTIVPTDKLPMRNHLDTPQGLATLVHAIAHIEYSAIDLALDAVYRFDKMPLEFKQDWLKVADDEIRHFKMLEKILHALGYKYGDFPVHQGFFDIAKDTSRSPLYRMAIIPRYYEASGLDVNPQIIKKLHNKRKDPLVAELIKTLEVILKEEIDHVSKGDKWFRYLCDESGVNIDIYFSILDEFRLGLGNRKHINVEARRQAGFSCEEIKKLGAKDC